MSERKSFVVAQIANVQRLFELDGIREVVPAMALASSLSVCGHCRGIANVRGQVVPVFDIARRQGELDPSQFIVIAVDAADSTDALVGILVDDVLEIVELGSDEVVVHPVGMGRTGRTVNLRGRAVGILTAREVVDAA